MWVRLGERPGGWEEIVTGSPCPVPRAVRGRDRDGVPRTGTKESGRGVGAQVPGLGWEGYVIAKGQLKGAI